MMTVPRCGDCKYYGERGSEDGVWRGTGICHRNPPPWSNVKKADWCGEFRPRNPEPVLETTTTVTIPIDGTADGTEWISSQLANSEDTAKPGKKQAAKNKKVKK